ncbi:MAG: hypothetical protein BWY65_01389 [Firmicutes bacterium ADurb.Bin373]|nr:MAG: hypothetical protein BWY65_01389 [Firmicutes bacterium ADurb.Bin373]
MGHGHFLPVFRVAPDGGVYHTGLFSDLPVYKRQIDAGDPAVFELPGQTDMGGVVFCHHQEA